MRLRTRSRSDLVISYDLISGLVDGGGDGGGLDVAYGTCTGTGIMHYIRILLVKFTSLLTIQTWSMMTVNILFLVNSVQWIHCPQPSSVI